MKPILIVKVPVGKMNRDKAEQYVIKAKNNLHELLKNHDVLLIVVPTRTDEYTFECMFASEEEIAKLRTKAESFDENIIL